MKHLGFALPVSDYPVMKYVIRLESFDYNNGPYCQPFQTDRQIERQSGRQTDKWAERQTEKQTDRPTDR